MILFFGLCDGTGGGPDGIIVGGPVGGPAVGPVVGPVGRHAGVVGGKVSCGFK